MIRNNHAMSLRGSASKECSHDPEHPRQLASANQAMSLRGLTRSWAHSRHGQDLLDPRRRRSWNVKENGQTLQDVGLEAGFVAVVTCYCVSKGQPGSGYPLPVHPDALEGRLLDLLSGSLFSAQVKGEARGDTLRIQVKHDLSRGPRQVKFPG